MDEKGAVKLKPGQTVTGAIPAVDFVGPNLDPTPVKVIPWQQAAHIGADNRPNPRVWNDVEIPENVYDRFQAGLPAPVRRTARQRNEVLIQRLLDMGKANTVNGEICWPDSIKRILDAQGVKNDGDLNRQVFALARYFSLRAENKQKENDARQVTRGWHGHYD